MLLKHGQVEISLRKIVRVFDSLSVLCSDNVTLSGSMIAAVSIDSTSAFGGFRV